MQILTLEQYQAAIGSLDPLFPLSVDIETNGKEPWEPDSFVVSASFASQRPDGVVAGFTIPFAHDSGQNADPAVLSHFIESLHKFRLSPFFIAMEAKWFYGKWQIKPRWIGDAYIAARILQMKEASLKDLTEKVLQKPVIRFEEFGTVDFSKVHPQDPKAIEYTVADAVNGYQLERVLRDKLIRSQMLAVYELEVLTMAEMAYQTMDGYAVDLPHLDKELKLEEERVGRLERQIFIDLRVNPFSINSPKKLGAVLEAQGLQSPLRTEKGNASWSSDAIGMIRANLSREDPRRSTLEKIIEWKSAFATQNSLRRRPSDVSPDGKMHPLWKTIGFDGTSRIYSEGPSLTSLPKPARRALKAGPGKRWVKMDWKQAEVRILANLSGDSALKEAIRSGDFHRKVYSSMTGVPMEQVTQEQRESSKVITYSVLYSGGSSYHVAQELGISQGEASQLVRNYFSLFPTLESYLRSAADRAVHTFHVTSFMNRKRRLEGTDKEKIRNQACNSLGQQSCGTMLKIALMKLANARDMEHPMLKGYSQVVPVFDALFYCIDEDVPLHPHIKFVRDQVELMLAGDVALEADFETGASWGELTKLPEDFLVQATADFS